MNHCCFEQLCASKVEDSENSQPSSWENNNKAKGMLSDSLAYLLSLCPAKGCPAGRFSCRYFMVPCSEKSATVCPSPLRTHLVVSRPSRPTGPRACIRAVLIPTSAPREKYRKSANNEDYMKRTYQWNMSKNIQAGLEKTTQRMSTQDHHIPSPKR